MDYIQVDGGSDDGIEFYGGTVGLKHGVFTNNLDDSVDWDEGYQGNLQYVIVKQSANGSGEAFEMDTQGTAEWDSKPTVLNATIIANKQDFDSPFILNFKAGSGGFFHNTIVTVPAASTAGLNTCVNVAGADSEAAVAGGALALNNWLQDCEAGAGVHGTLSSANVSLGGASIVEGDALLDGILSSQNAAATRIAPIDWTALGSVLSLPGSAANDPAVFDPTFFDQTDYLGAVNPNGSDPWWIGWTLPGTL